MEDDNLLEWLRARCFSLEAGRARKEKSSRTTSSRFKVMGIGGDVLQRRKLWFLLSFLPSSLGANWMAMDCELSVLWMAVDGRKGLRV